VQKGDLMKAHKRWPSWTTFAMRLALGAGILAACFQLPDMSALPDAVAQIDVRWLLLALILAILGTVLLPSLMTQQALELERIDLSLGELVLINFAIRFYVLVLPRAASIGIRWLRYTKGGEAHDALALMVYERLMQLFAMTLIGAVALAFELDYLGDAAVGIFIAAAACVVILGALLLPFLVPATAGWLASAAGLGERIAPASLVARIRQLLDAVTAFHRLRASATLKVVSYSLLSYVLFIASPYAVVVAMDADISLLALAWIRPLVFLLTLLPFTIGGLGIREAGFIGLLHLYSIAPREALVFSLILFAIQIAIGLVGLVVELWRHATMQRSPLA
jgi:uncharacterized protein (TIRG00374 family)